MWRSGSPWEAACCWPRHWLAIGVVWANTAGIAGDAHAGHDDRQANHLPAPRTQGSRWLRQLPGPGPDRACLRQRLMLHVYGFLVVVAAGLTLRQVEQKATATAASMPFQPRKRWQRLGRCWLMWRRCRRTLRRSMPTGWPSTRCTRRRTWRMRYSVSMSSRTASANCVQWS